MWRDTAQFGTLIPSLARVTTASSRRSIICVARLVPGRPARRPTRNRGALCVDAARDVRKTLKDLRFSNSETEWIAILVERWQQLRPVDDQRLAESEEVYAGDPFSDQYLELGASDVGRERRAHASCPSSPPGGRFLVGRSAGR